MIIITFALSAESTAFVRLLEEKAPRPFIGADLIVGKLHGREITVLHTGVGREIASKRIADLLNSTKPDGIISTGFAGGLAPVLKAADLLIAENYCTANLADEANEVIGETRHHLGRLTTSDEIVFDAQEREKLFATTGALAVDMETAAIADACHARKIPMLALRGISDTSSQPFPIPPNVLFDVRKQRTDPLALSLYLISRPLLIPRLFDFARRIRQTRRALAQALDRVVQAGLFDN